MPHLDPTLPTLAELTRMVEASWLTAKPQPTPWPVIERRSLRRLIARVRLHRRRAARCAALRPVYDCPPRRRETTGEWIARTWPALLARIRGGT